MSRPLPFEVFISYASQDRPRALSLLEHLSRAGVSAWLDRNEIRGGSQWAAEIVRGIKGCKVLLLLCSEASMRSWAVKQEIQLAGEAQKALLPLQLEPTHFPEQIEFFLAGRQWIEIGNRPATAWLPEVLHSLERAGVGHSAGPSPAASGPSVSPVQLDWNLEGLRRLARFTDQLWPIPAVGMTAEQPRTLRGLGAPQDDMAHDFRLGSRVRLVLESDRPGHLLLLDEGPEGTLYCLCPSHFVPDDVLPRGRSIFPQSRSPNNSFVLTGKPGREELLAIISDERLALDWMTPSPRIPARVLTPADVHTLLGLLKELPAGSWTALATWFDVTGDR